MKNDNPLLQPFNTPHESAPFNLIHEADYLTAFRAAIEEADAEVQLIAESTEAPTFANTIEALDRSGARLSRIASIFFNLLQAEATSSMQELAQNISPLLTAHSLRITLNRELFMRVKAVHENSADGALSREERMLLTDTWRMFIAGGANLEGDARKRFETISEELSLLQLTFNENDLFETNAYTLHLTEEADLEGLPDSAVAAAREAAQEEGKSGWLFSLHAPSAGPFLKYSSRRDLRERLFRASARVAYYPEGEENPHSNTPVIHRIVALRSEMAALLGYKTYADYALDGRMAGSVANVNRFLEELLSYAHPAYLRECAELQDFAHTDGLVGGLERWDWAYYSNRLRHARFSLDDELLKPYFALDRCIAGVFSLATRLYGITFREVKDVPVYHTDVTTYEVLDTDGSYLALLYLDFFPRPGKSSGAWMTEYKHQWMEGETDSRPHISLVMNFTKPVADRPSLLTHYEVNTFLHEFGHALHGIFSRCRFPGLSCTNVDHDFVELPSQFMENYSTEKEWLDSWARHYRTGETIPNELIEALRRSAQFQAGYACNRQLSFGMLDMCYHTQTLGDTPLVTFEREAFAPTEGPLPKVEGTAFSTGFSHIFEGEYAAGYYSYKWSEVLDADAFSLFLERGIFDRTTAQSFRDHILSRGGSEEPMILYKQFRGQEPTIKALLRRDGLIE